MDPIAPPQIDITSGEKSGAVSFDATVEVRPLVVIPGYDGLQVTLPGLAVSDEEIDRQVDRLRENDAELESVNRPAQDGDFISIDLHGNDTSDAEVVGVDDYLYEVGSGSVVAELHDEVRGTKSGEILAFAAPAPGTEEPISFRVRSKTSR